MIAINCEQFLDQHPEIAEHIRTCSEKPAVAKSEGRKNKKHVRSDWFDVSLQLVKSQFTIAI